MPVKIEILVADRKAAARIKKFAKAAGADVKKLEKQSVASSKRMSTAFQGVGRTLGVLGIAFGAGVAIQGFKKMVQAASDTQESLNKVREVFGSAATAVESFSLKAATALGASRQEALAMTGELGNLLVAFGFAEKKAGEMSVQMVQLAADLGSFNNVPTVDALNAIRSALVGESEPIRRFGADVRQARLDQIALAEGLDFTKGKMDSQTKALAAMKAIMLDTGKAQGDFARTSSQLANASKTLGALTNDLSSDLGQIFLPVVRQAVLGLTGLVTGFKDLLGIVPGNTKEIETLKNAIRLLDVNIERATNPSAFVKLGDAFNKLLGQEQLLDQEVIRFKKQRIELQEKLNALLKDQANINRGGAGGGGKVVDREKELRDSILASLKLQADKLRIINQLKAEGLIPLTEEDRKAERIFNRYKKMEMIKLLTTNIHAKANRELEKELSLTNLIADDTARWAAEAEAAKQQLFEAAGILNDIVQLASGARKFSISGLFRIGAGIAGLIPGGQGVAALLGAGSIATSGFAGGGRPVTGRPNIIGERGPELFIPDRPGTIVPNNQITNNTPINITIQTQTVDEFFVTTKLIPILRRSADRGGLGFVAS